MVADVNETWPFDLEKDKTSDFLDRYKLKLKNNKDSKDLENVFFKGRRG